MILKYGGVKPKADELIKDVPDLEVARDECIEGQDEYSRVLMSGYPHQIIEDGNVVDNKDMRMFSDAQFGALTFKNGTILG